MNNSTTITASEIQTQYKTFQAALIGRQPTELATLLDLPSPQSLGNLRLSDSQAAAVKRLIKDQCTSLSEATASGGGSVEWGTSILRPWALAVHAARMGDYDTTCKTQFLLHASLNQIFSGSAGNWLLPALHVACRNSHQWAVLADEAKERSGMGRNDHKRLQGAVTLLQESFSKALNDRTEFKPSAPLSEVGSKKAGVLYIVNQLFSMYFRLNTLRLCKNLLRPVESRNLHEEGTMGDRVTYRYYVGRLHMFEDHYEEAEQHLDFALLHCHKASRRNKRRILNYLVPVKLLRGRLPTRKILEKYALQEFLPIVEGIRKGDLRTFQSGLTKNQELFIRRGTYLLLEKCKTVCYRNLFKRVFCVLERTQIPLQRIVKSLDWLGFRMDLDEVECILANLIYRGYVRGYISHSKRVLVLSKKDPFPVAAVIAK